MNFQVRHPQLEYEPGQFREGIRRFNFSKNMNSFDYPEIARPVADPAAVRGQAEMSISVEGPDVTKLRQQLYQKQQEVERLKYLSEKLNKSQNPSPQNVSYSVSQSVKIPERAIRQSYDENIFQIAKHPAFQQPKFTKRNPKVVVTSPITGYHIGERSLGHYGNLVVSSNKSIGLA
jgi:hypothetical protein